MAATVTIWASKTPALKGCFIGQQHMTSAIASPKQENSHGRLGTNSLSSFSENLMASDQMDVI